MTNFANIFEETTNKITQLVESKADAINIVEELTQFNKKINHVIEELHEIELNAREKDAFPTVDEVKGQKGSYKYKIVVCGDPEVGKTSIILKSGEIENAGKCFYQCDSRKE